MTAPAGGGPPWVVRRLLVVPLVVALAALAVLLLPLVALVHAVTAAVLVAAGREVRWRLLRLWLFAVTYLVGEVVCLVACLALWLRHLGRVGAPASRRQHLRLLGAFLALLVGVAERVFRFRLALHEPVTRPEDRERLSARTPVIVLARHAGPGASFVLVHLLLSRYGRRPQIVLSERLRWDPSIDVLLSRIGCSFIGRGGDTAAAAVERLAGGLRDDDALVLYPEGGDWTPTRHRLAVSRLRRKGLRVQAEWAAGMPHVLPPRPAGTVAALRAAPHADVVVVTHTGHDELLDAQSVWAALPLRRELDVVWWRELSTPAAAGEEAVASWLFELWQRISDWVDEQRALAALSDR